MAYLRKKMEAHPHKVALKRRLMLIGAGVFFVFFGLLERAQGTFVSTNYLGQSVFSAGVVPLGGLMIALGLAPASWVARLALTRRRMPLHSRQSTIIQSGKK